MTVPEGSTVSAMRKFLMTAAYRDVTKDKLQTANKLNNDLFEEAEYWRNKWCDFYIQVFYANESGLTKENAKSTIEAAQLDMKDFVTPIKQTERIRHFADARQKAKTRILENIMRKLDDNFTGTTPDGSPLTKDMQMYIKYIVKKTMEIVHEEESKMSAALLDPDSYDADEMETSEMLTYLTWIERGRPPS